MSILTTVLTVLGLAQKTPVVQAAETKALTAGAGLIKHLFGWIETKEAGHPFVLAATEHVEAMVEEYGEEDLIAFLASKGVQITIVPPVAPSPAVETPPASPTELKS